MAKSPNLTFFKTALRKHRTSPKLLSAKHDYIVLPIISALVGAITGLMIALFEAAILWTNNQRLQVFNPLDLPPSLNVLLIMLLSGAMVGFSFWLTLRFAPEASGSGITHIEGALDDMYDIRWRRLLPVKLVAGTLAIASGMIFGRAGPAIQIGGTVGRMFADTAKRYTNSTHILVAAGAAAGLAAVFNAPLAGILFVIEEMRPHFRYNMTSIKCVTLAAAMATIVMRAFHGQDAVMPLVHFDVPPLTSLWLFLLLGSIFGVIGVYFNRWIISSTKLLKRKQDNKMSRIIITGILFGCLFALLQSFAPDTAGNGRDLMVRMIQEPSTWAILVGLFVIRLFGTIACFASGAPGGVFTPMLTLGTLFGLAFGVVAADLFPSFVAEPTVYAIAGMGALFAATVRAPVTGIVLVVEMTDSYELILPLLITCLGATFVAQAIGGKPLYAELLKLSLPKEPVTDDKDLTVTPSASAGSR
jgi:CIC family chloride channel protein